MPSAENQIFKPDLAATFCGSSDHVWPMLRRDAVTAHPGAHVHDRQPNIAGHVVGIIVPDDEGGLKVHNQHDTRRIAQINPYCITPRDIVRSMNTAPADRLRKARMAAGFETAEAAALGRQWKPAGYRHHENGTRPYFDIDNAVRYARAFKVDVSWLLGLSEVAADQPGELNAVALGQVIEALLQAYAPHKKLGEAELLGLGEALKETLQEMMGDPEIGGYPDRAAFVAKAVLRARRRVGQ